MKLSAFIFVHPVAAVQIRALPPFSFWHKQNGKIWVIRYSHLHPYRKWGLCGLHRVGQFCALNYRLQILRKHRYTATRVQGITSQMIVALKVEQIK